MSPVNLHISFTVILSFPNAKNQHHLTKM